MIHKIHDRSIECDDGKHRNRDTVVSGITVHRFGTEVADDMLGVSKFYRDNPKYTDGQNPYTYGIKVMGQIERALPINEVGPHAKRWSISTIGVVFFGDFSHNPPNQRQWEIGVDLVAELCSALAIDPLGRDNRGVYLLEGHTLRPESTNDPFKQCPGICFDMHKFRIEVASIIQEGAIQRLSRAEYRS